jgi:hypothetical protein
MQKLPAILQGELITARFGKIASHLGDYHEAKSMPYGWSLLDGYSLDFPAASSNIRNQQRIRDTFFTFHIPTGEGGLICVWCN